MHKKSLLRRFIIIPIVTFFVFTFLIIFIFVNFEYDRFNRDSKVYEETYVSCEKQELKSRIEKIIDYIKFQLTYTSQPEEDIKNDIIELISTLRFENDEYIFVFSTSGQVMAHPYISGKTSSGNPINIFDQQEYKVFKGLLEVGSSEEGGFLTYLWKNYPSEQMELKLTYSRFYAPWDWVVSTGVFIEDINAIVDQGKQTMLEQIRKTIIIIVIIFGIVLTGFIFLLYWVTKLIGREIMGFNSKLKTAIYEGKGIDQKTIKYKEISSLVSDMNELILSFAAAQENLRTSEERWQLAIKGNTDGIWDINFKTNTYYFSPRWKEMLGYADDEFENTNAQLRSRIHPDDLPVFDKALSEHLNRLTPFFKVEYRMKCKDGFYKWILSRGQGLWDSSGNIIRIVGSHTDITETKQSEKILMETIKVKDYLLKEIHHRVKNNLQVISSLLNLQAKDIHDPFVIEVFRESQNRIRAMAVLHEKLYGTKDITQIGLKEYISDICRSLIRSYGAYGKVELDISIKDVSLGMESAVPCGLIINELVSNSLKYAFKEMGKGLVKISVLRDEDLKVVIITEDNGIGLPKDIDIEKPSTLGLQLVVSIVENQLHGKIYLCESQGTKFRITFRELNYKERI